MKGSAAIIVIILLAMTIFAEGISPSIGNDIPPPTNVRLWNMGFGVMVTWAPADLPPDTDESYEVYRSNTLDPSAVWTFVGDTVFTNINDTEVEEGTWYYYVITVTERLVSNRSEVKSIHYEYYDIDMSEMYDVGLMLSYSDAGYVAINVVFDMSLEDRMEKVSIITLMRGERGSGYEEIARIDPGQDTHFDLDVDEGKTYYYRVIAEFSDGTIVSDDEDITIPGDPPADRSYLAYWIIASVNALAAMGICLLALLYNLKVSRREKRDRAMLIKDDGPA